MKVHAPHILVLAIGFCLLVLTGCDKSTAGGSDEIDTRIAVNPSGIPVSGARIVLVPSGDSSGQAAAISATASNGTFPDFQVADGYYSVLLQDQGDSLGKYLDSLRIVAHKVPSGRDTLRPLGEVEGVIRVGAGDSPAMVSVGLYGTELRAKAGQDGSFVIQGIPAGVYTFWAIASQAGYGELFLRFQLLDGQELSLDTLVLPSAGLSAPKGLFAVQDTASGAARISWSSVPNPSLGGYWLRRAGFGDTADLGVLQDTSATDSLDGLYLVAPYLGPWPTADLTYILRSVALDGSVGTGTSTALLHVVPPGWTRRVDSVRAALSEDSTGRSTLRWRGSPEPDLAGWEVSRSVGGTLDCSSAVSAASAISWSDSSCADAWRTAIDSLTGSQLPRYLWRDRAGPVVFQLATQRRLGRPETLQVIQANPPRGPAVVWRDSGLSNVSSLLRFAAFGGWILRRDDLHQNMVSRDGTSWETLPDTTSFVGGTDDSLWTLAQDTDSTALVLGSRVGPGQWSHRRILVPFHCPEIMQITANGQDPMVVCWNSSVFNGTTWWTIRGDTIESTPPTGLAVPYSGYLAFAAQTLPGGRRLDMLISNGSNYVALRSGDTVIAQRSFDWTYDFIGAVGVDGGIGFTHYDNHSNLTELAWYDPVEGARTLPIPSTWKSFNYSQAVVFHDEIWLVVDNRLWKGKLVRS
jgi:hypothetical protein